MKTITEPAIKEVIEAGQRFVIKGQTLTIDLVRTALTKMPFAVRGEEIIDIDRTDEPMDIDLLRRSSVL